MDFDASLRAGNFGRVEARAAFNAPIIEDKLAFRIAALSQQSDGYYKNGKSSHQCPGLQRTFSDATVHELRRFLRRRP